MEEEQDGSPSSSKDEFSSQGRLLGWGSGEFAQHGHGVTAENVDVTQSEVSGHTVPWTTLKDISCGASHTAVITDQCESYSWGNSNSGQLGCGDKGTHSSPQKVLIPSTNSSLVGVACGGRHTVWWTENGRCYSSGNNFYAQLGYDFRIPNYKENQNQTAAFSFLSSYRNFYIKVRPHLLRPLIHHKVVQVSCGEKHSLFLFDTGLVSGCGCNSSGQLGSGSREEVVSPKIIEHLDERTITRIACGPLHSLAVTDTGELFVWGSGRACGNRSADILLPLRKVTKHSNVVFVAGGSSHSMALSACGSVYSWGGGADGQLGFGKTLTYLTQPRCFPKSTFEEPISQIACGETYSAAVTVSGKLYMWGRNTYIMPWCSDVSAQFHPMRVNCQSSISKLACGSWHAAAITGYPAWQPLTDDSSDEDFSESDDDFEDGDHIAELQELESQSGFDKSLPENMKNPRSKKFGLGWKSLSVSLEEFYAPTPLPAIRPISQLTERRLSLQSCESAIIINKEEMETIEQPHQKERSSSGRNEKAEMNSDVASDVQHDKTSYEFQERNKFNSQPETVKRKEGTRRKGKHPRHMINNKDIKNKTAGKVSSAKSIRKGELLVGSLERAKSFPVLGKHGESLSGTHSNRGEGIVGGNSSHTTNTQKQKASLNSTDIVMEYQITHKEEVRRMPPRKMTRAHTYYGKMSAKPPTSKIKTSPVCEEDKIKTYFDQVVRSNTKVQLLPKTGKDSKQGRDRSKVPTVPPPQQRATYSSASSWRNGDQRMDVLISLNQKKDGR